MEDVFDATCAVLKPLMPEGWLLELPESKIRKLKADEMVETPDGPKTVTYQRLDRLNRWRRLKLTNVIAKVQDKAKRVNFGPKRNDPTHCAATISKYVRCFMYMNFHVHELPLALRDARREWAKGAKDLDLAFHKWKSTFPYIKEGFTRIKDYHNHSPAELREFLKRYPQKI
jgi:hypothetical protein